MEFFFRFGPMLFSSRYSFGIIAAITHIHTRIHHFFLFIFIVPFARFHKKWTKQHRKRMERINSCRCAKRTKKVVHSWRHCTGSGRANRLQMFGLFNLIRNNIEYAKLYLYGYVAKRLQLTYRRINTKTRKMRNTRLLLTYIVVEVPVFRFLLLKSRNEKPRWIIIDHNCQNCGMPWRLGSTEKLNFLDNLEKSQHADASIQTLEERDREMSRLCMVSLDLKFKSITLQHPNHLNWHFLVCFASALPNRDADSKPHIH